MADRIHYTANDDTLEGKLMEHIGTGITEARSASFLIKRCRFTGKGELNAAIAAAWAHKNPILQYRGQYFRPANAEEFTKYVSRQTDANGDPVIEFR